MTYSPPLKDIRFTLDEVAAIGGLKAQPVYAELSDDLIGSVLLEAGKIAAEVFAPLNRAGDVNPARLSAGGVRTSPGFKEAYEAFAGGGWLGLTADPDFGGAGLPHTIACAVYEMFNSANASLTLGPILALGAVDAISHHASEELKRLYLPKIVSGEWLATMNLTESQAGSDLGDLKTRAIARADGSYRLFGSKIFISWGDHDLTDNIIHLVLARTPNAPEG
jgi:alkylation response protein AidB-like acyl-CoA dehydrogenase